MDIIFTLLKQDGNLETLYELEPNHPCVFTCIGDSIILNDICYYVMSKTFDFDENSINFMVEEVQVEYKTYIEGIDMSSLEGLKFDDGDLDE